MSSGITCPFGQLAQSPGYVSDSLLTRSPLALAGPCDLHVLATPPAFRLSQDQTLQLNFLDPISASDPPCQPLAWPAESGDYGFGTGVILETSLSTHHP